jgi:haloacetate dehalogenase
VATDLRGYGDSGKPVSADDHSPYAMPEVAQKQLEVMQLPSFDVNVAVGLHPSALRRCCRACWDE